jgi:transposase
MPCDKTKFPLGLAVVPLDAVSLFEEQYEFSEDWKIVGTFVADKNDDLYIHIQHSEKMQFTCKHCGCSAKFYDLAKPRVWRCRSMAGHVTYLCGRMPRYECPQCQRITAVSASFAPDGAHYTYTFMAEVIETYQRYKTISDCAGLLKANWHTIDKIVKAGYDRGMFPRRWPQAATSKMMD